jgi:hypothetical protein
LDIRLKEVEVTGGGTTYANESRRGSGYHVEDEPRTLRHCKYCPALEAGRDRPQGEAQNVSAKETK